MNPLRFDAVVIGSGFAGAATAYHLTQRNLRHLLILEREHLPGLHASGRNASLAFQPLVDAEEARLAVEGCAFLASPPPGFTENPLLRQCGSLLIASERRVLNLLVAAEHLKTLGVQSQMLTPPEARQRVPLLEASDFAAASWTPSDGVVDIRALLRGYLRAAVRAGAEIRCAAPVVAIETSARRVTAVQTTTDRIETPLVINAAGAWAGEIGQLAGVGPRTLAPRRRHMYRAESDQRVAAEAPFVWHDDVDVYFRPDEGLLLMSPCDATPHPSADPEVDVAMEKVLFDKLRRAFPPLARSRIVTRWACLRTFTADEHFLIGRDPELRGFVWVAGLGGHGMTTSSAVGRLGAGAALGEASSESPLFTPARFAGMRTQ